MKRFSVIVALLIVTAFVVVGCSQNASTDGDAYNLYFSNLDQNNLVVEQRNIEADDLEDVAEKVLRELLKGPSVAANRAVIPSETKLLELDIDDGIASVNLTKAYFGDNNGTETTELLARYSIVNTLCDIEGIRKVKIFIDGVELTNSSGMPVGALGKEDILLSASTAESAKEEIIVLYFPDKDAINLVRSTRKVPLVDNSVEKTVVHELIKGPDSAGLITTIPAETKVVSVETKDGICFVNLSSEFVSKHSDGSVAETFTLYSIVNSLTELDGINSVQFLIEGKKAEVLKHMLLDRPYARDESYIKQ